MSPLQTNHKFLRLQQAAEFLGVPVSTVRFWIFHKKIPYFKPGGKLIYFTEKDLSNFVMSMKINSGDALRSEVVNFMNSKHRKAEGVK